MLCQFQCHCYCLFTDLSVRMFWLLITLDLVRVLLKGGLDGKTKWKMEWKTELKKNGTENGKVVSNPY